MLCHVVVLNVSPTPSIVQIIFLFWPFEISGNILRNQNIIIGFTLETFSNEDLMHFGPLWKILVFKSATLLKVAKLQ